MYCRNCGKELKSGENICQYCETMVNTKMNIGDISKIENKANIENKFQKNYIGFGALILVITMTIVGIIFANRYEKIDVEEIVKASFYGYDTVGEGNFYIDETKVPVELQNTISITPEYVGFLTNGDEVEISVSYDNSIAKEYGIEFVGENITITVSGLTELIEVNPFDGLSLNIDGISPYATVSFVYNGNNEYISTQNFVVVDNGYLKNGDEIAVEYRSAIDIAKYGYKITQDKMKYVVDGLDEYVSSFSDLSDEFVTELRQGAADTIISYTSANYSQFTAKSALEYVGYVYNTRKEVSDGNYNAVYIVYRSFLSSELDQFEEQYIYYPVKYTNIICEKGKFSAEKIGIQGYTQEGYDTKGYRIPSEAYNDIVTEKESIYSVSVGGGFEKYAHNGYVYSVSEVNSSIMKELEEKAFEIANKYLSQNEDLKWYTVSEPVKVGGYFLVSKNQSGLSTASNRLILVYSSVVSDSEEGSKTLYLPVIYKNLQIYPEGGGTTYESCSITDEYRGINYWLGNHTRGFIDESVMYSLMVEKYVDKYDEEVFGDLKIY